MSRTFKLILLPAPVKVLNDGVGEAVTDTAETLDVLDTFVGTPVPVPTALAPDDVLSGYGATVTVDFCTVT